MYTPNFNFFGSDSFDYVLVDATGAMSNVATVTVTVSYVPSAPTANADDFAMLANKALPLASRTYNVIANDIAPVGDTIDPGSLAITTLPLHGTARANTDGTITYTPALNFSGVDTLQYTVASKVGLLVSAPATLTIVVESGPEAVSMSRAVYVAARNQWTLVGSTNWFGPQLTHTTVT